MPKSASQQIVAALQDEIEKRKASGEPMTRRQKWVVRAAAAGVVVVTLAPVVIQLVQAFKAADGGSGDATDDDEFQTACRSCGEFFDDDDLEDGFCEDCADSVDDAYCCGVMYTDGETNCFSCGEPLY